MIALINRLESIGSCREKLKLVLHMDVFNSLSKYNPEWQSEHEREDDLLDRARRDFAMIQNVLGEISETFIPLDRDE